MMNEDQAETEELAREATFLSDELTWLRKKLHSLAEDPGVHPEARRVLAEVLKEEWQ